MLTMMSVTTLNDNSTGELKYLHFFEIVSPDIDACKEAK